MWNTLRGRPPSNKKARLFSGTPVILPQIVFLGRMTIKNVKPSIGALMQAEIILAAQQAREMRLFCASCVPSGPHEKSAAFNKEGGGQNAHGKEARAVVEWIAGAQASPGVALRV